MELIEDRTARIWLECWLLDGRIGSHVGSGCSFFEACEEESILDGCTVKKIVSAAKMRMLRRVGALVLGLVGLLVEHVGLGVQTAHAQVPSIASSEIARGKMPDAPMQPQLAIDDNDAIHVAYGVGNRVIYIRSNNSGEMFSEPVDLAFANVMSLGMRRGPRITVSQGTICITAIGGEVGKGRDGDVLARCSRDGGRSWSRTVRVNDVEASAREGLHAMASGPDGLVCCVWLDLRNRSTELMASISTDGGESWSANKLVYKSPSGSICECCNPSVAISRDGSIFVQWRNSIAGKRDVYFAVSTNRGASFKSVSKQGLGEWSLGICPMDGGAIAVDGEGPFSTWRRDNTVYLSQGKAKEEKLLGMGEQPWIAVSNNLPWIVWLAKRGGEVFLLRPNEPAPEVIATNAWDPVIASSHNPKNSLAVAWESAEGDVRVLRFAMIRP